MFQILIRLLIRLGIYFTILFYFSPREDLKTWKFPCFKHCTLSSIVFEVIFRHGFPLWHLTNLLNTKLNYNNWIIVIIGIIFLFGICRIMDWHIMHPSWVKLRYSSFHSSHQPQSFLSLGRRLFLPRGGTKHNHNQMQSVDVEIVYLVLIQQIQTNFHDW